MKIAIIENDLNKSEVIGRMAVMYHWDIHNFRDSKEFGKIDLSDYDVVIADCSLSTMTGRDLIKSISGKTRAQMFLMSDSSSNFFEEDIDNVHINGFINKDRLNDLVDHLKYIDSKLRINKLMELETNKINNLLTENQSTSE